MTTDGLSGTIGLVTSSLDADYTRQLIAGATEVLTDNGLSPLCFSPGASQTTEYAIPLGFLDLVDPRHLSGVIFTPPSFECVDSEGPKSESSEASAALPPQYDTERFLQRIGDLPAVCVGAGITGIASLWIQNGAGIRLLMKHLTETCGRRRIAFIRGRERNVEAKSRFRAWEDFCIERSLPHGDELVELGDFTLPSGEAAALRILEKCSGELPDAFVASNDRMALGVLRALRAKALSVPIDVSVVGFDDLEATSANPPLTTIRQPIFEMGHRAAEVLIAKMKKESVADEQMVTPELVVRASCQPNRRTLPFSQSTAWRGSGVFLDSASSELLTSLLRDPIPDAPLGDTLARELESRLQRARNGEQEPVAGVRGMRTFAIEQLDQALSRTKSQQELHSIVRSYLGLLGLESLTVALLLDRTESQNNARLVVDCSFTDFAITGTLGDHLAGAQILAAHGRRTRGLLSVVEPLYHEEKYCGFLVASGMLLDNPLLHQLGTVLTRVAVRLSKQR